MLCIGMGAQEGLTLLGTCTVVSGGSELPGEALLLRTPSPSITWINCTMEQLSFAYLGVCY